MSSIEIKHSLELVFWNKYTMFFALAIFGFCGVIAPLIKGGHGDLFCPPSSRGIGGIGFFEQTPWFASLTIPLIRGRLVLDYNTPLLRGAALPHLMVWDSGVCLTKKWGCSIVVGFVFFVSYTPLVVYFILEIELSTSFLMSSAVIFGET